MATIDQYKINVDVTGEQAVNRLRDSIGGLGSVIAGIGFGAFVAGAFRMADAFNDIAASSGLAVGEVAALANALKEAGGEYEDVGKVVARFYNTLEQGAADSSSKAAEALAKVGITLNELRTLSEGQLLAKALDELSRMEAGAQRTALGMEIFGKSFAKIDPATLQKILATQDVEKLQQEMLKAAEIVGNLEASFFELQKAALSVLAPIIGETENFRLSAAQAEKIVKILGAAVAIAFGAAVVRNIMAVVTTLGALVKVLRTTAVAQAAVTALTGPAGWAVLAGAAAAAAAAIYGIDKALGDANKETVALGNSAKKTFGQMNAGKGGAFPGATGVTEQQAKAREKEALAAQQVTEQMKLQNKEANDLRQKTIDTIGMESDRANLIKSNAQAESDSRKQIADLDAKIVAERAKGKDANAAVVTELQRQKAEVSSQLEVTKRLNEEEYRRLQINKEIERNLSQQESKFNRNAQQKISNKELEIAKQRALGNITEEQGKRELDNYKAQIDFEQQSASLIAQYYSAISKGDMDRANAISDQMKNLEAQRKLYELMTKQRLEGEETVKNAMAAGTVDAIANIAKQFEPYKMAQDAIMIGWNALTNALDTFVKTGKFKFGDFAKSVIADISLMITKFLMFQAIGAALQAIFPESKAIAAIFKREKGGPVKDNQPYIVGEKGPELFVPKSAGTVIPNNKLAASAQATGTGMVNAPVTNNYITNNISAVDAKSVAQLFAENRKTLLGTVQMAQREMPYG